MNDIKVLNESTLSTVNHCITAINRKNKILNRESLPSIVYADDGFPVFHNTQKDQLLACNADKIIVDQFLEGYNFFEEIKNELDPNKTYFLFANGTWDQNLIPANIKLLNFNYILFWSTRYSKIGMTSHWFENYVTPNYNGKFCAIFGNKKPWRTEFINKLQQANLMNNFISYQGERLGTIVVNDPFTVKDYDSYRNYVKEDSFSISHSVPVSIFNATSYCICAETNMYPFEEFHLTEKTIKCLSAGMPFVMLSSYQFLQNLKMLGFRTYSELWNEDYDRIRDNTERMDFIIELCKELEKFDWYGAKDKLNEIALHNIKHLLNSGTILEPQIIKLLETLNGY